MFNKSHFTLSLLAVVVLSTAPAWANDASATKSEQKAGKTAADPKSVTGTKVQVPTEGDQSTTGATLPFPTGAEPGAGSATPPGPAKDTALKIIQNTQSMPEKARPDSAAKPDTAAVTGQTAQLPATPEWHRLQSRLSGSLCLSCLKELENSLKRVYGVQSVKVEKAPVVYNSPVSPELGGWANGVIIYDSKQLPFEDLKAAIKQCGYQPFRIVDSMFDAAPSAEHLKFRR